MTSFPASTTNTGSRLTVGISVSFVCIIVGLPLVQFVGEVVSRPKSLPVGLRFAPALIRAIRDGCSSSGSFWQKCLAANSNVCQELRAIETEVTTSAWPVHGPRDRLQAWFSTALATGNEQVDIGRDGWMFFRPDVDALTAPGFLQPEVARPGMARKLRQTNPLPAIRQFAADLAARGIDLVLLPIPSKASLFLANRDFGTLQDQPTRRPIHNVDFPEFLRQFPQQVSSPSARGAQEYSASTVSVSLVGELDQKFQAAGLDGVSCFLKTDTHWTPQGLDVAVRHVAAEIRRQACMQPFISEQRRSPGRWRKRTGELIEKSGDTAVLLGNLAQLGLSLEQVRPIRIVDRNEHDWAPDVHSQILVLGDSFLNIYSQEELGWGTAAGFVEQLSFELGCGIDRIAINAGGALASRQELIRDLQQGRDRLAGKRLVIWEFAERELSFGDWQVLSLPEFRSESGPAPGLQPADTQNAAGNRISVTGKIIQLGRLINPQSMPYREALLPVHLNVTSWGQAQQTDANPENAKPDQIVVYLWGLKNRRPTPESAWRVGESVHLKLVPWAQAEAKYGRFARIELDDPDSLLLDLPTFWGEPEP